MRGKAARGLAVDAQCLVLDSGAEFDTDKEISAGLQMTLENIDSEDVGQNLSEEELAAKQKSMTARGSAHCATLSVLATTAAETCARHPTKLVFTMLLLTTTLRA